MKSIEIYLPLSANDGTLFSGAVFESIEHDLTEKFGGVTAHKRAPAQGRWQHGNKTHTDEIIIFEVVADTLDKDWWRNFRKTLERQLDQEKILIVARDVELL